jgi:hypothetical protein
LETNRFGRGSYAVVEAVASGTFRSADLAPRAAEKSNAKANEYR